MAEAKKADEPATVYVVARGEIPQPRHPKTRIRPKPLAPGDVFTPAADDDVARLLADGVIMTQSAYANATSSPSAQAALDSERARADRAEAELAALKAAAPAK